MIVVALILSALVNYLYIAEGNLTPLFNSSGEDIACQDGSVCSDASSGCSKPVSRVPGLKLWSGKGIMIAALP